MNTAWGSRSASSPPSALPPTSSHATSSVAMPSRRQGSRSTYPHLTLPTFILTFLPTPSPFNLHFHSPIVIRPWPSRPPSSSPQSLSPHPHALTPSPLPGSPARSQLLTSPPSASPRVRPAAAAIVAGTLARRYRSRRYPLPIAGGVAFVVLLQMTYQLPLRRHRRLVGLSSRAAASPSSPPRCLRRRPPWSRAERELSRGEGLLIGGFAPCSARQCRSSGARHSLTTAIDTGTVVSSVDCSRGFRPLSPSACTESPMTASSTCTHVRIRLDLRCRRLGIGHWQAGHPFTS